MADDGWVRMAGRAQSDRISEHLQANCRRIATRTTTVDDVDTILQCLCFLSNWRSTDASRAVHASIAKHGENRLQYNEGDCDQKRCAPSRVEHETGLPSQSVSYLYGG